MPSGTGYTVERSRSASRGVKRSTLSGEVTVTEGTASIVVCTLTLTTALDRAPLTTCAGGAARRQRSPASGSSGAQLRTCSVKT